MNRRKIDYGIDLGTTNSAIARMDSGEVRILKSKDSQSDTTPSCVFYNKRQICFAGLQAFNAHQKEMEQSIKFYQEDGEIRGRNAFAEFKRTMGTTDEYSCSNMNKCFCSEELSAEVLKKLRSNVDDEEFTSVVITVPAMFKQQQIDATQRAAELAGFQYCEILQEPIAASIAYGLTGKSEDGYWLVFDFGGGTFDAALMRSEEGIIKVVDTSGDNHLGGKNLDYDIVDRILIPHLEMKYSIDDILDNPDSKSQLRDTLKPYAEEIKKLFSTQSEVKFYQEDSIGEDDCGEEMELDLQITLAQYEAAISPRIQRAIDISLEVLDRNHVGGSKLAKILLVGGPTFLPTMRRMLREQITPNVHTGIDPMTAVAVGAAVFASTRDVPNNLILRNRDNIQLILRYPETTVEPDEKLGIKVDRANCSAATPPRLFTEVSRKDGLWSSGRVLIDGDAEIIEIQLLEGKPNSFSIRLFDESGNAWPCEPNQFSIIQGFKPPEATLPFNLCLLANLSELKRECIVPIPNLEKNVTLPAKGRITARTQVDLQPGKPGEIRIALYGSEQIHTRAFPSEIQDSFVIHAKSLPQFLPADSPVVLQVEVNASRGISVTAFFPSFDEELIPEQGDTIQALDEDDLSRDLRKANASLAMLQQGPGPKSELNVLKEELNQIEDDLQQGGTAVDTRVQTGDRLTAVWKKLDELGTANEWPNAEAELREALEEVCEVQEKFGTDQTGKALRDLQPLVDGIIQSRDLASAKKLVPQIYGLRFAMLSQQTIFWVSLLQHMDESFQRITWKSPGLARQILNEAKQHVAGSPTKAKCEEYVRKLWDLQPDSQESMMDEVNRKLLKI